MTSNPLDREEFLAGFLVEADEHLRSAATNLLALETAARRGEPQAKLVRELFRALHTLKGLAAMVDVEPVVDLAHEMEAVLRGADRGGRKLSTGTVELLLRSLRAIEPRVRAVGQHQVVPAAPRALIEALSAVHTEERAVAAPAAPRIALDPELLGKLSASEQEQLVSGVRGGRRALRIDFVPSTERAMQGVTITSVRERVGALGDIVKVLPRSRAASAESPGGLVFTLLVLTAAPEQQLVEAASTTAANITLIDVGAPVAEPEEEQDAPPDTAARADVIRVEVARLDDALERLSDLVVSRFSLQRAVSALRERGVDVRELNVVLAEGGRQLRDLRASIMRARMVSVSELLERVPLLVRGLGQRTGKAVRLEVDAGKAELDKAVAERIFPAVVHLVRNAVDHALEPTEERVRAGKPAEGLIRVACFEHSDSRLELTISDDGRGIDAAGVARRAGAPTPANAVDLLELVCRPGISTLDAATTTSGRGMGMNIVKRTIEELRGDLLLETHPGKGTSFTLCVPLSISILDAFSFECAAQSFVVPVSMVDEIVEVETRNVVRGPAGRSGAQARLLERRGAVMPLMALSDVLGLRSTGAAAAKAIVVRREGEPWAFAVDRMLGQQEVVLRPFEDPLVKVRGISGSTDLGDGRPTLVVDLVALAGQEVGV